MRCCGRRGLWWTKIQAWTRTYENLLHLAVNLIYAQIACALIGSLGPFFNGVLVVNLVISLFALVAIECSSQSLARTYALLLFCSIWLDISWFVLFSNDIWNFPNEFHGSFVSYSVKLTLAMQIIGFSARALSSLMWIQMYRLGAARVDNFDARASDADLRNSFLNPGTPTAQRPSCSDDEVLGGSVLDAARYSAIPEDGNDDACTHGVVENHGISIANTLSSTEISVNSPTNRFLHIKDRFRINAP